MSPGASAGGCSELSGGAFEAFRSRRIRVGPPDRGSNRGSGGCGERLTSGLAPANIRSPLALSVILEPRR
jgi:hypothetical protein